MKKKFDIRKIFLTNGQNRDFNCINEPINNKRSEAVVWQ